MNDLIYIGDIYKIYFNSQVDTGLIRFIKHFLLMARLLSMRRKKLLSDLETNLAKLIELIIELKKELDGRGVSCELIKLVKECVEDADKTVIDSEED